MKSKTLFITLLIILISTVAFAGTWDTFKDNVGLQVIAYIGTGILAIGAVQKFTNVFTNIFISVGTFLVMLGTALQDSKLSKNELNELKAQMSVVVASIKKAGK